jgi:hypothetical protein
VSRYSQAQLSLRTRIAGVLHDASPDRVGNRVSTSSKLLLNVSSTIRSVKDMAIDTGTWSFAALGMFGS